jgi:hypothetical protein
MTDSSSIGSALGSAGAGAETWGAKCLLTVSVFFLGCVSFAVGLVTFPLGSVVCAIAASLVDLGFLAAFFVGGFMTGTSGSGFAPRDSGCSVLFFLVVLAALGSEAPVFPRGPQFALSAAGFGGGSTAGPVDGFADVAFRNDCISGQLVSCD